MIELELNDFYCEKVSNFLPNTWTWVGLHIFVCTADSITIWLTILISDEYVDYKYICWKLLLLYFVKSTSYLEIDIILRICIGTNETIELLRYYLHTYNKKVITKSCG